MTNSSNRIETITLEVAGMTCGSCERHIRKELEQVPGYREARVSLAEDRVQVSYDAAAARPDDLVEAVVRAGYPAVVAESGSPAPREEKAASCACCVPRTL